MFVGGNMWIIATAIITLIQPKLSWEKNHPERAIWTAITLGAVEKAYKDLDTAQDTGQFCPNYAKLSKDQRIHVWGELFSSLAFYESGWNPHNDYTEATLGIDKVTGLAVMSSGLLQLSYGDVLWAKWCPFNWERDRQIRSFLTSIHDPKNNLECGIGIMAYQIRKHGRITIDKGVYWSTLRAGSQRAKIGEVVKWIQEALPFCGRSAKP